LPGAGPGRRERPDQGRIITSWSAGDVSRETWRAGAGAVAHPMQSSLALLDRTRLEVERRAPCPGTLVRRSLPARRGTLRTARNEASRRAFHLGPGPRSDRDAPSLEPRPRFHVKQRYAWPSRIIGAARYEGTQTHAACRCRCGEAPGVCGTGFLPDRASVNQRRAGNCDSARSLPGETRGATRRDGYSIPRFRVNTRVRSRRMRAGLRRKAPGLRAGRSPRDGTPPPIVARRARAGGLQRSDLLALGGAHPARWGQAAAPSGVRAANADAWPRRATHGSARVVGSDADRVALRGDPHPMFHVKQRYA